jgi:hypothetical protein
MMNMLRGRRVMSKSVDPWFYYVGVRAAIGIQWGGEHLAGGFCIDIEGPDFCGPHETDALVLFQTLRGCSVGVGGEVGVDRRD